MMRMNSVQRPQERYRIIYLYKILQGTVPNPGISYSNNDTRGRMINIPNIKYFCSSKAKQMREQSLGYHGGNMFNLLPIELRNCHDSLEIFKTKLDAFLADIPDQPLSTGLYPEPINQTTMKHSNSLVDWIRYLKLNTRRGSIPVDGP